MFSFFVLFLLLMLLRAITTLGVITTLVSVPSTMESWLLLLLPDPLFGSSASMIVPVECRWGGARSALVGSS